MGKRFKTDAGTLIKVPDRIKEALQVLVRQIDDDQDACEALYWLIWMMEMRGVPPRWPTIAVREDLLKKGCFMKIENYSLSIPEARETIEGYAALKMPEGKRPFTLRLQNHSSAKTEVNVKIHGIDQGTWILNPYQTATLERPAHLAEKFCAYAVGSEGGNAIGLREGDEQNGLVRVKFSPQKWKPATLSFSASEPLYRGSGGSMKVEVHDGSRSFSAAGVGTEGVSSQTFGTAQSFETDEEKAVTISLRIVEDKDLSGPCPLSSATGNPIPKMV